jgi:hypothetical protein
MPAVLAAVVAVTAAAKRKRQQEEEEEDMTPLHGDPSAAFEYKIIRSVIGVFKHPAKFKAILEEEARAGWDLFEKLDCSRARLRRPISWRQKEGELSQDPYRTRVGISEGRVALYVVLGIVGGIATIAGILVLVLSR